MARNKTDQLLEPSIAAVEVIRAQFPALKRSEAGRPVAYFDGPGGTQAPQSVVDAVADYLLHHNANAHWSYPTSVETDAALDAARQALADLWMGMDRAMDRALLSTWAAS